VPREQSSKRSLFISSPHFGLEGQSALLLPARALGPVGADKGEGARHPVDLGRLFHGAFVKNRSFDHIGHTTEQDCHMAVVGVMR
jgi:hypothetical protein